MFVKGHVLAAPEVSVVASHSGAKVPGGLSDIASAQPALGSGKPPHVSCTKSRMALGSARL